MNNFHIPCFLDLKSVFSEFEGKDYEEQIFDGDVKYHLGWTSERITESKLKI